MTVNESAGVAEERPNPVYEESKELLNPEWFIVGAELTLNGITGVITAINSVVFTWYVADHERDYTFPRPTKGDLWAAEYAANV